MFPDFMCIGAQKAGTSWLFANLKKHPQIVMPIKEVHYFDKDSIRNAPLGERLRDKRFRKKFFKQIFFDMKCLSFRKFIWDLRYYLGNRSDEWYHSLFTKNNADQLIGDITPAYSTIDADEVEHIASLMPNLKVILILRNPIDRAYSAAKMNVVHGRSGLESARGKVENLSEDDYVKYFNEPWVINRGDYMRTINNWQKYFPAEQMLIGFLEDIIGRPAEFLDDVCRFLEISSSKQEFPKAEKAANVGLKIPMPDHVGKYLAEMYMPGIDALAEYFSDHDRNRGYVEEWRTKAESLLRNA